MNHSISAVATGIVLGLASAAQSQVSRPNRADDVPPVLRMAIRSLATLRYSGTRTVELLEGPDRQQHVEYVLRDGDRLKIWFPNSSPYAGQVIVENQRQRRHYFPGRNEVMVGPPKREEAFGRMLAMLKKGGFHFSVERGGLVAGLPTQLVTVREGDALTQKLWIDPRTGMVLRRDLLDRAGTRVGYYEFSEIDFTPRIDDTDFTLTATGAKVVTPAVEAKRLAERAGMAFVALPESEGYQLESSRVMKAARVPILQQSYMGSGAALSLFQAKGIVDLPLGKRANGGGMNAVTWTMGGNTFVLVGRAPEDELKRLARLLGMR